MHCSSSCSHGRHVRGGSILGACTSSRADDSPGADASAGADLALSHAAASHSRMTTVCHESECLLRSWSRCLASWNVGNLGHARPGMKIIIFGAVAQINVRRPRPGVIVAMYVDPPVLAVPERRHFIALVAARPTCRTAGSYLNGICIGFKPQGIMSLARMFNHCP